MPRILPFGRVVPPVGGAALRLPLGGVVLAALLLGAPLSAPHSRLGAQTTPAGGAPEIGAPEVEVPEDGAPEFQVRRTRALAALDRYWRATLARSPFLASSHGDRTADRRFPREGPEVRRQQVEEEFQLYKELSSLDTRGLDEQLRLDVSLLAEELSERVDAFRLHTHLAPIHQRSGPQLWLPAFHQRMRFEREGDFDDYLARLSQVPAHLDGVRELLEQGMETGFLPPRSTLDGVLAQFGHELVFDESARELLGRIVDGFCGTARVFAEVRHRSWNAAAALDAARDLGVGLLELDYPGMVGGFSRDVTGVRAEGVAYFRLHGRNRAWFRRGAGRDEVYDWRYSDDEVRQLCGRVERIARDATRAIVVANNHFHGKAMEVIEQLLTYFRSSERLPHS